MGTDLSTLGSQNYINLETYRRSGAGVRTPVWFAATTAEDGSRRLYVYSAANAGKVKRIRRSGVVRIAPCDMRGQVTDGWIEARAGLGSGEEFAAGMRLLDRKYWPWKRMLDLLASLRSRARRVMIVIQPI